MLTTDLTGMTPAERVSWLTAYITSMTEEIATFGETPSDTAKINYARRELALAAKEIGNGK